ncbi:MAG: hypothetical protein CO093_05175 [Alphaproteobacteria bacterium CG_4_9_14_3_um_filter_47_13]|nr:MAG: hypothetical protein CO093_05175 [Alphaproteobacteria bacterium CG_4_9_14_3_um_filter_47_13]
MENIYTIRVSLDKKTYRDIAIQGEQSLYKFAESIIDSFDFDLDHAFGFFSNLESPYGSSEESYELFADMEDYEPVQENTKGVEKTKIADVYEQDKKMLFLFDYGDDWIFMTECIKVQPATSNDHLPKIINSVGEAPEQYPDYEDCDDEEAA